MAEDSGRGPIEDTDAAERARLAAERAKRAVERAESRVGTAGRPRERPRRPPQWAAKPGGTRSPEVPESTLRQRRGIAIFGGLLVLGTVVALIAAGSGDDEAVPETTTLQQNESGRQEGIRVSAPPEWERNEANDVIRFRSPDGEVQALIDYSPNAGEADAALQAELAAIEQRYEVVNVREPVEREVGGLEGQEVLVSARDRGGPVNFLLLSANGDEHTYVLTILSRPNAPEQTLAEGQQIVNSLRLTG